MYIYMASYMCVYISGIATYNCVCLWLATPPTLAANVDYDSLQLSRPWLAIYLLKGKNQPNDNVAPSPTQPFL